MSPTPEEPAIDAKARALMLALGPFSFQAASTLLDLGVLSYARTRPAGVSREEVAERFQLTPYAATVLLEAGLAAEVFRLEADRFVLTRAGHFLEGDEMARVNMAFTRDICYRPLAQLGASLHDGKPRGLPELAPGLAQSTSLYADFAQLPEPLAQSWLAYDHFCSRAAFAASLPYVFSAPVHTLLDVGANTGRFAEACLQHDPDVRLTLLDHPVQVDRARARFAELPFGDRVSFCAMDLGQEAPLPPGFDVVWLSQLLDCLSESVAEGLLARAACSLAPGGRVLVLEPCWDLQPHAVGTRALQLLSLYFACVANGESRMFESRTLTRLIEGAGLRVVARHDDLGIGHSLFECVPA